MKSLVGIALVALTASTAWAEEKSAAETAFRHGRELLADGKVAAACNAFATSQKLEPALGTLLNLAACHEREGRTATAWAEFNEVRDKAAAENREQFAAEAESRIRDLEPRLTRLRIKVAEPRPDALVITRHGSDVSAAVGTPVPVDLGRIAIEARAPGYKTRTTEIEVSGSGRTVEVTIPRLEPLPEPAARSAPANPGLAPAQPPAPANGAIDLGRGRRIVGLSIGGGGVAALATGLVFGALAKNKWDESRDHCNDEVVCSPRGTRLTERAVTHATASTVLVSVGLAAVGAGVYIYLTGSRRRTESGATAVAPYLKSDGGGIAVTGRF